MTLVSVGSLGLGFGGLKSKNRGQTGSRYNYVDTHMVNMWDMYTIHINTAQYRIRIRYIIYII